MEYIFVSYWKMFKFRRLCGVGKLHLCDAFGITIFCLWWMMTVALVEKCRVILVYAFLHSRDLVFLCLTTDEQIYCWSYLLSFVCIYAYFKIKQVNKEQ